MGNKFIITIDGPSGSGKSTTAKRIANELNITYLDTGAMYRAVAYYAIEEGYENNFQKLIENLDKINIDIQYRDRKTIVHLNGKDITEEIRTLKVSNLVSPISAIPKVRNFLLEKQRSIAQNSSVILDGRDTGTVVFPDADVKIYLIADIDKRAERRLKELQEAGHKANFEEVKNNLINRDLIDSNREIAPLKKAVDAIEVDTSNITIEQQVSQILNIIREKLERANNENKY